MTEPSAHIPVLVEAVLAALAPRDDAIYVDATFGAGGYSEALLGAARCRVFGIDRDPDAVARGEALAARYGGRLTLIAGPFGDMERLLGAFLPGPIAGIAFDLGVSSMQIDEAERGFSFRHDGPLDMRMSGAGPSAADVVRLASERDLAAIIATLGEERHARAVARAVVAARLAGPIDTTAALAAIVSRVVHARATDIHPATRTFQALRIFVNEELDEVAAGLAAAERILAPGGRLVVIAFHSLEDRIVKTFLGARSRPPRGSRHLPDTRQPAPTFRLLVRRPITADAQELADNPRARSAKLRAAERTDAPAATPSPADLAVPSLADIVRAP